MLDGGGLGEGPPASILEEASVWSRILDDASIAKKISSESWVRSFAKETDDYQRLDQIGEGETERVYRVKGTVKAKGVSSDGQYVIIVYEADTGRGSGVKEVRISSDGVTVNGRPIVDVEISEDGAVYLHYKKGDDVFKTPIKLPVYSVVEPSPTYEMEIVTGKVNLEKTFEDPNIKTTFDAIKSEIGIQNPRDFTDTVAYAYSYDVCCVRRHHFNFDLFLQLDQDHGISLSLCILLLAL